MWNWSRNSELWGFFFFFLLQVNSERECSYSGRFFWRLLDLWTGSGMWTCELRMSLLSTLQLMTDCNIKLMIWTKYLSEVEPRDHLTRALTSIIITFSRILTTNRSLGGANWYFPPPAPVVPTRHMRRGSNVEKLRLIKKPIPEHYQRDNWKTWYPTVLKADFEPNKRDRVASPYTRIWILPLVYTWLGLACGGFRTLQVLYISAGVFVAVRSRTNCITSEESWQSRYGCGNGGTY